MNLQKLFTPPKYFQKLIFSLKILEMGKCPQQLQNALSAWAHVIDSLAVT